ncbi:MAG: c-type cytochrome [Zoogloea sp.]|nr:c-type cytochrome [Zoogloea sp.]
MKAHPKHLGRLAALALLLATAAAHGAPPAGRLLASQCAQCHGTNGQAVAGMEKLAGESESEIYGELIKMKANIKPDEIMHRQAAGYSDAQIRLMARYFATGGRTTATSSTGSTSTSTPSTRPTRRKSHDD